MNTPFKNAIALLVVVVALITVACAGAAPMPTPNLDATIEAKVQAAIKAQPTGTLQPTYTPLPTYTPFPTYAPLPTPTNIPVAIATPRPTYTPLPTYTPFPIPTDTPTPTTNPNTHFDKGKEYYDAENCSMAIDQFTVFIGLNDQIEDAFYYRAGAYYKKGQEPPTDEVSDCVLGWIPYVGLEWTCPKNLSNEIQNAIDDYTKAIQLAPKAVYYDDRGAVYYWLGQYQDASTDFSRAIRRDPKAVYYFNRGRAYDGLVRMETDFYRTARPLYLDAIEDYAMAFGLESDVDIHTMYYNHLVSTCNALDRRSKPGDGTSEDRIFKANC
jgi:tetratricopeptide (TPR) repeat protein